MGGLRSEAGRSNGIELKGGRFMQFVVKLGWIRRLPGNLEHPLPLFLGSVAVYDSLRFPPVDWVGRLGLERNLT